MDLAYKALCNAPGGVFTDQPSEHCTTEGTPLTDLGHGLGHTKNGVECSECGGSGYEKRHEVVVKWRPYEPCEKCVFLRSTLGCRICGHLKWHRTEKHDWVYYICAPCKGTGEIEVLNPVIPKGFLTGGTYLSQKARKRLEQQ